MVINSEELKIDHVLNYPNPFTTKTAFWFEHNYPSTDLYVKIELFTLTGKLIKTISQTINTPGNRSNEIEWDGRDEYGKKIGRGVYLYRLRVKTIDGKTADKWERLVVLTN
jgi:flagellar hook assembly protein FlgD